MVKPIISGPYRTFRRLHAHESFLEYEGSTITIPMRGRRSPQEPWMEDEISLKAFMRLEIYVRLTSELAQSTLVKVSAIDQLPIAASEEL
jgi:hypothetical protein